MVMCLGSMYIIGILLMVLVSITIPLAYYATKNVITAVFINGGMMILFLIFLPLISQMFSSFCG